jgi:putative acetyltransferase
MLLIQIKQQERNEKLLNSLLKIWETSVRLTHAFLSENDVQTFMPIVKDEIKNIEKLVVAVEHNINTAFIGVRNDKIEMLFVAAEYRNNGIGSLLVKYAIDNFDVKYVDVNEQNEQAIIFYKKHNFNLISRSETDEYGNPYPILHLAFNF